MRFLINYPSYLYLLIVLPALILAHFLTLRIRRSHALKFANFDAIARVSGVDLYSKNIFILILTSLIFCCAIFSLCELSIEYESKASDFSFVIALDSSKSMEADDVYPTRFEVAKRETINFINSLPSSTPIGIISFSGNSYIHKNLVSGSSTENAIRRIELGDAGGTDISEAILTSVNLLEGRTKKAVIILSDGQLNVGELDYALDYANEHNVLIHTLAIGTLEGGETSYGFSKIDEDSLKAIAYNTKGKFSYASDSSSIRSFFDDILEVKVGKVVLNLRDYLIIAIIFLLFLEYILINTRFKAFP